MKSLFLILVFVVSFNNYVGAQSIDTNQENQKEVNNYKKSSDYIYAEDVYKDNAFDQLLEEVNVYKNHVSDCETSPDKIKENAILIEYFDYEDEKNYFFYIPKKSLLKDNSSVSNELIDNSNSVLEKIISYQDYFSLKPFIDKKQEEGVVQYRQLKEGYDDTRFCYWIIFDNSAKIIAVLDKSCKIDLLSNRPISKSDYQSNKKMWIQIY